MIDFPNLGMLPGSDWRAACQGSARALEAGVAGLPRASTDSRVTEWPQGQGNGSPVTVTVLLTVTVTVIY